MQITRRTLLNNIREAHIALMRAQEDRGATAVEYGLIVALIAAIIVGIVGTLGGQVDDAFTLVSDALPA
jgi:pilus assembly protein Flp/PilA